MGISISMAAWVFNPYERGKERDEQGGSDQHHLDVIETIGHFSAKEVPKDGCGPHHGERRPAGGL